MLSTTGFPFYAAYMFNLFCLADFLTSFYCCGYSFLKGINRAICLTVQQALVSDVIINISIP